MNTSLRLLSWSEEIEKAIDGMEGDVQASEYRKALENNECELLGGYLGEELHVVFIVSFPCFGFKRMQIWLAVQVKQHRNRFPQIYPMLRAYAKSRNAYKVTANTSRMGMVKRLSQMGFKVKEHVMEEDLAHG